MSGLQDAAAAAAGEGAGTGQQPANSGAGEQSQEQQQVQGYRPEGLSDDLFGAKDSETIDKLYGKVRSFEELAAKRGAFPQKPEEYSFTPAEKLAPYFGNEADDPVMKAAQVAAHKHGMSNEEFNGFVNDVFSPLVEAGVLAPPYDPNAELAALGKAMGFTGSDAKKQINQTVQEATAFADGFAGQMKLEGALGDQVKAEIMALTDTAGGVVLLTQFQKLLAENGFKMGGASAGASGWTKEKLKAAVGDPRLDPMSGKYEKSFHEEYDQAYKSIYG